MNVQNRQGYITSNDFTAIDKAIDFELQKRNELNRLYASQKHINRSTTYLYACASLCLLLITGSFIYWLFFIENKIPIQNLKPNNDNSISLKKIANNDETIKESINTSFTVFQRKQMETGEYVVTGKNFTPEDLITPEDQYCYVEPITAESGMAGEPIASMVNKELLIETTDEFLIKYALPNCQFTQ
jgi:hypothetical protein